MMKNIKFYVRIDENNVVRNMICDYSVLNKDTLIGYTELDTMGYDKSHFTSDYLKDTFGIDSLYTEYEPNFKYENNKLRLLTEAEKQKLFRNNDPQPTAQEKFNANMMREIANLKLQMGGAKNV